MSDTAGQELFEGAGTALFVRGALAILFAILVILWPGVSVLALVYLFGFYAGVEGIANIVHYFSDRPRRSVWTLLGGIVSVLAGVVAFAGHHSVVPCARDRRLGPGPGRNPDRALL